MIEAMAEFESHLAQSQKQTAEPKPATGKSRRRAVR
jgi:hypothetical protein